jgi:RimJ/RimL family protein N-acetyltransferase
VEDYERLSGLTVARGLRDFVVGPEVSPEFLEQLAKRETADVWQDGFGVSLGKTLIGFCSFACAPSDEGVVEIAYGIAPGFQGRGYATAASLALIEYAKGTGRVSRLCAHTLPQENASTHVLRKCGFAFFGKAMHSQDGEVWRWERPIELSSTKPVGTSERAQMVTDATGGL